MKRTFIIATGVLSLGAAGIFSAAVSPSMNAQAASARVVASQTAAEQTIVFAIENMTCALCPVTVKTAMGGVEGVQSVKIDFAAKTATVVFDPSVTTPEAIAAASTNVGYPATPAS